MRELFVVTLVVLTGCPQKPPAPTAPATAASSSDAPRAPELGHLVALGRIADRAAARSGPPAPDGDPDVVFEVRIVGPVVALALSDSDPGGKVQGNAVWSTALGDTPIRTIFGVPRPLGRDTWTLAVNRDGTLLNPDGVLPKGLVLDGTVRLHIADPGKGFGNGKTVVLLVQRPNGTIDRSAGAIL